MSATQKKIVLIFCTNVPMTTSPGRFDSPSLNAYVLTASSSQDCLDDSAIEQLAGQIAADPEALTLHCLSNSDLDADNISNWSTQPIQSAEGAIERRVPETPQRSNTVMFTVGNISTPTNFEKDHPISQSTEQSSHISQSQDGAQMNFGKDDMMIDQEKHISSPRISVAQSLQDHIPAPRLDLFDRLRKALPETSRNNAISEVPMIVDSGFASRSLRKRRDIQLHPFTIEKLHYKAQVGHAHDSHLSQAEIQKRRAIREKYVAQDDDLLARAAEAKNSKQYQNAQRHNRRNTIKQRQVNRPVEHKQSKTTVWQAQRKRMAATYAKKRTVAESISNTQATSNVSDLQQPTSPTVDKSSRRTMQQQLDLLFPEFSFDRAEDDNQYTRKKKRRRVIQDESDADSDTDSVQYLGESQAMDSTNTLDDNTESQASSSTGTKRVNRLEKLKQKRALKGILPMSFTKVFSKELTEDQKMLESRRTAQKQNHRKRMESGSLAREVYELSISSDHESTNSPNEVAHTSDIFTDEESEGENENNAVWSLDDWLGEEGHNVDLQEDLQHARREATTDGPVILRDKDPIDRMVIRSSAGKRVSNPSRRATASTLKIRKVSRYSYNRSVMTRAARGTKKSTKRRTNTVASRLVSKQSFRHERKGQDQPHIWHFMDIRKTRNPSPATPNPDTYFEAEDEFFRQKGNEDKDLPTWVKTLLQARNNMKKLDKDRPRLSRPIIPSGIGPFYRSVSDVTNVNWWQRPGKRRLMTDVLENTEPTQIEPNHFSVHESLPSAGEEDVQIINPKVPANKQPASRKIMVGTKQSRLFEDHGFSKKAGPSNLSSKTLMLSARNTEPINIVKMRHKERKAIPKRGPSQSQINFIQFLNDTRDFPTTYSFRESSIDWHLPSNGYINQGFLKNLEDRKVSSESSLKYVDMVTNSSIFCVFGISFDINGFSQQELEKCISSFFLTTMKTLQNTVFQRSIVNSDTFHEELFNFFAFITIWLAYWIPLVDARERELCISFISREIMSFQKRLMRLTNLQTILNSRDPAASVDVVVIQVMLLWFIYSTDWEIRIQRLESTTHLRLPSQLDLMLALLLWLGPDRSGNNESALNQLILETWICYLHSLARTKPLSDPLSYIIEQVHKGCVSDGLDNWKTSEMMWQWISVLADIYHYDAQFLHADRINVDHLWSAIHRVLQYNTLLIGEGDCAYTSISQHMNISTNELMDEYIRALFCRVHQLCKYYPSSAIHDTLLVLQSFYLNRRFQDLATERDSSFPEFFIDFMGHIPHEVASQDTCFHIFLKTLCITLQNEQASLSSDTDKERQQLRRFLSQLAPTHVMTIRKDDPLSGKYSALGNHFNLNMLFAHVVSTDIQRRSILQAKSFLNFHDSDHIARKMYFEAFTLLSRIYAFHEDRDGLNSIVKLLNERLGYLCDEFSRMQSHQSMTKHGFFSAEDWQADQIERQELIESGFIYIWKIVRDAVSMVDDTAEWFEVAVLSIDKAWSSVLDKHKPFAANTRLYAVNFIRSVLTIRDQRVARLKDQSLHHNIVDASLSSSLRSGDSQDFDMFDDFDYGALNMDIEKVYYDDTDRMLAQSIKSWVLEALQQLQPQISSDDELQETINLAISESLRLLTDHHM
ncbi:hypothetical protein INT43_005637 [Umbelopsis isabellina]|uniref:Uncharacterized protein n=1 Tax=Mortierella isabellina TaxID=91625 RepID=A0A8H7PLW6_MORIS|nr:hypothetical protein INT43_005637 [Umbelopsis isabellina]